MEEEEEKADKVTVALAMFYLEQKIQRFRGDRAELHAAWEVAKDAILPQIWWEQRKLLRCLKEKERLIEDRVQCILENWILITDLTKERAQRLLDRQSMDKERKTLEEEKNKLELKVKERMEKFSLMVEKMESRRIVHAPLSRLEELPQDREMGRTRRERETEEREREESLEEDQWTAIVHEVNEELKLKDEEMEREREKTLAKLSRARTERSMEDKEQIDTIEKSTERLKEQMVMKKKEMRQERRRWSEEREKLEKQMQRLHQMLDSVKKKQEAKKDSECQVSLEMLKKEERKQRRKEKRAAKKWEARRRQREGGERSRRDILEKVQTESLNWKV